MHEPCTNKYLTFMPLFIILIQLAKYTSWVLCLIYTRIRGCVCVCRNKCLQSTKTGFTEAIAVEGCLAAREYFHRRCKCEDRFRQVNTNFYQSNPSINDLRTGKRAKIREFIRKTFFLSTTPLPPHPFAHSTSLNP